MNEAQFHHWLATHLKDLEQDEMALVTKCLKCGGEWTQNEHGRWVNKHDPDTFYGENFKSILTIDYLSRLFEKI